MMMNLLEGKEPTGSPSTDLGYRHIPNNSPLSANNSTVNSTVNKTSHTVSKSAGTSGATTTHQTESSSQLERPVSASLQQGGHASGLVQAAAAPAGVGKENGALRDTESSSNSVKEGQEKIRRALEHCN